MCEKKKKIDDIFYFFGELCSNIEFIRDYKSILLFCTRSCYVMMTVFNFPIYVKRLNFFFF